MKRSTLLLCLLICAFFASAQINAAFTSNIRKGCSPVTIQFNDNSAGANLRYLWSFGNGNISTQENPQAIFYQPGKYTVQLTVTDANGVKSHLTKTAYIVVYKNPEANFFSAKTIDCANTVFQFDDQSKQGDTSLSEYLWDFGDGVTKTTFGDVDHIYKNSGFVNPSLIVKDYHGCVSEEIKANYIKIRRTPKIDFKAPDLFNCKAPFTVDFNDKSKFTDNSDTYFWDFGDGTTSSLKNPSHTYTKRGNFDVTLIITTAAGCSDTLVKEKYVK